MPKSGPGRRNRLPRHPDTIILKASFKWPNSLAGPTANLLVRLLSPILMSRIDAHATPLELGEDPKAMTRRSYLFAPLAAFAIAAALFGTHQASAQNEFVLAEVYGRGVHAYYAGQHAEAFNLFTQAIEGGTRDPRAYYFRGIVSHDQGRPVEAEEDWKLGAEMEARSVGGAPVGASLSRFQGSARLKLEEIRQKARLEAALTAAARSDARMNELGVQPSRNPAAPAPPVAATTPPPAPSAPAADDPFADDGPALAGGQPKVEKNNALEGADGNPFADDAPLGGAPAADGGAMPAAGDNSNPFGEPAAPAGGDPFGGDAGADPFGTPAAGGGDDPFGGDPFGN